MKIVLAMDSFYPTIEGPVIVLNNFAEIMTKNHDVTVMVPSFGEKINREVEQSRNFPYKIQRVKAFYEHVSKYYCVEPNRDKELKKFMKEEDIDIVHLHSPFMMASGLFKMAKKRNIPTIFTFHTKFKDEFLRVTHSKLITKILMHTIMKNINRADYVYTVSEGAKKTLQEYGYKKPIYIIRNGTDLTCPLNIEERRSQIDELYHLKGQPNVFLFVGRMVETKNLKLAFEALKILNEEKVDFKFLVVGDGTDLGKFKNMVKENNLTDKVIFTGAISDRDFLKSFYLRSDLFLFPSIFDTASLVPLEAATFSLPTLLVKDSPTSEIIIDNQNGYAEEADPKLWAKKLLDIINNPSRHKLISEACRKEVYRTWEDVVNEMLVNYEHIIEERKK